jgi:hypothetical protein
MSLRGSVIFLDMGVSCAAASIESETQRETVMPVSLIADPPDSLAERLSPSSRVRKYMGSLRREALEAHEE